MPFDPMYRDDAPSRDEIDAMSGPVLVEFGANWCGHCQALTPELERALQSHPEVQHIRVADGPGKPLGRSFRVKLWPNLVMMRDGQVIRQLARPTEQQVRKALGEL